MEDKDFQAFSTRALSILFDAALHRREIQITNDDLSDGMRESAKLLCESKCDDGSLTDGAFITLLVCLGADVLGKTMGYV